MNRQKLKWTNWGRNQSCIPEKVVYPCGESDLINTIKQASTDHLKVKAVGSGHSFTGIALTTGVQVNLSRYNRIVDVDKEKMQATVQVGKVLSDLNIELWQHGLSMSNLGDIGYQTVAGALSTGTHGSGIKFGCLSSQVVGARVITGEGEIVECSKDRDNDTFQSAIVGVGSAGLLSTVTLQLEPAFNLHSVKTVESLESILTNHEQEITNNDHFQYLCYPNDDRAYTKRFNRTTETTTEPHSESWFASNVTGRAKWLIRKNVPLLADRLPGRSSGKYEEDYVARSYSALTFEVSSWVSNVEMEYFIPKIHAKEAIERILDYVHKSTLNIWMPIQVRWIAGDDIPMSMCFGRDTTSIAIHVGSWEEFEPYFVPVETMLREYEGRPHWGKMHFQTFDTLRELYPKWDIFQQARKQLDPKGIFQNDYTDRVLGKIE
mgnify:FL=1